MSEEHFHLSPLALLRLQSWVSPAFPTGSYSYSHGLEWAVEAEYVQDRKSLVDWLEADLSYGSGRNEAIFFREAWRCAMDDDRAKLSEIAELAAAFRGSSEFALESSQQGAACLATLRRVWPDRLLDWLSKRSASAIFRLPSLLFLGFARRGRAFRSAWPCPPSCKVTSPIW